MTIHLAKTGSRWRHRKTDHIYEITGECRIEATLAPAFLYVRIWDDGSLDTMPWARPRDEFLDGRFEPLPVA